VELIPFDLPSNVRFTKLVTPELSLIILKPLPKLLAKQRQNTKITIRNGIPHAETSTSFKFKDLADTIDGQDAQAIHERAAWELIGILFDSVEHDLTKSINAEEHEYIESRLRKDNLSNFWMQLVHNAATQQIQLAKSAEEKVIAHLSAHDIEGACAGLIDGRNFRLATLVALIGGDEKMRDNVKAQIQTWRDAKALSEFEEPIRALYELLTGNVCGAYGVKGPAEDRATTFLFSERFGFDWRQSFGMRLWYAIFEEDPLELAVEKFSDELENPQKHLGDVLVESSKPVPWFVEQKISTLWQDPSIADRNDLLWSILRLYAKDSDSTDEILDEVLLPHNHQLSPLDYRLSWLLYQTLSAKEIASFPRKKENGRLHHDERVDRLTLDYAWQLERSGDWSWATFVLLHLHDHDHRKTAVQSIIARHAGEIGGRQSLHFIDLVTNLRVPESWIWEAKALFAREVQRDFITEVDCLLKAQNWSEAHKTLCSTVAPNAIIEGNYSALERILSGFENVDLVRHWGLGGQVYLDFIHLRHLTEGTSGTQTSHPKQKGLLKENDIEDVLKRLVNTLPSMITKDRSMEFLQQVAVQEMSGIVAKALVSRAEVQRVSPRKLQSLITMLMISTQSSDLSRVLQLPLTEDMYLKHSVNLSFDYYRTLMAGGK
jgi:nuclear pore complex protein Nup98-Nup96